jgi:hypothetical protein
LINKGVIIMARKPALTEKEFRELDPSKSPEWRLEWAIILNSKKRIPPTNDLWVDQAAAFLRHQRRSGNTPRLQEKFGCVCAAFAIYEDDGITRDEIEARLLAGQALEDIAVKTALAIDTLTAYVAIFYDIVRRLHATDWICAHVLPILRHWENISEGYIWRYLAWHCPDTIEVLIADFKKASQKRTSEEATLADRIRLYTRLELTPSSDPHFPALHRAVQDDLVNRSITSPGSDLAETMQALESLALTIQRTKKDTFRGNYQMGNTPEPDNHRRLKSWLSEGEAVNGTFRNTTGGW